MRAQRAGGAASGQGAGLAFRIAEASFGLNIQRLFAAPTRIALAGIAICAAFAALWSYLLGRWQERRRF